MGTLTTKLVLLPPRDPESRGVVERRNGWFATLFMPGRAFASRADFNAQFADWLSLANTRAVRTIKAAPVERLDADRAAMPLPPIPLHLGCTTRSASAATTTCAWTPTTTRLDPTMIGRMVDVVADLHQVRVRTEGRVVTEHTRVWAKGMTVTEPAHVATAARLPLQFQQPRAAATGDELTRDLARDLRDHDRAFGLACDGDED